MVILAKVLEIFVIGDFQRWRKIHNLIFAVTLFLARSAANAPTPNAPGYDADFGGESGIHVGIDAQHSRQRTQQSPTGS